jgi:hypothetical protein
MRQATSRQVGSVEVVKRGRTIWLALLVLVGVACAIFGTVAALGASSNQSFLGNRGNAVWWAVLALSPWAVGALVLLVTGLAVKRWRLGLRLAAFALVFLGLCGVFGRFVYSISGL